MPSARFCHDWLVTLATSIGFTRFRPFLRRAQGLNGIELENILFYLLTFSSTINRDLSVPLWSLTCWKRFQKAVESSPKFMFEVQNVGDQIRTRNHAIPYRNYLLAVQYV